MKGFTVKRLLKLSALLLVFALGYSMLPTVSTAQAPPVPIPVPAPPPTLLTPAPTAPSKVVLDEGIRAILEQKSVVYEVHPGFKIFRIGYNQPNGRTQKACIASFTETLLPTDPNSFKVRRIWSVAYSAPTPPSAELLVKLMNQSNEKKIGAWEILREKDGSYTVMYNIKAPADTSPDTLVWMVQMATYLAEQAELEFEQADLAAHQGEPGYAPKRDKF